MVTEKVTTLSKEEVKAITKDNVKWTVNLTSHLNKLIRIQKAIDNELKKYREIVLATDELNEKLVTKENKPRKLFSKDEFIAKYGEDAYEELKVLTDYWTVTYNG